MCCSSNSIFLLGAIILMASVIQTNTHIVIEKNLWPNGTVPYVFDSIFDKKDHASVQDAIRHIQKYSCLKFVPRTNQMKYVVFIAAMDGCWTRVGYNGFEDSRHVVNLQRPGCLTRATVIRQLLHVIGFYHEHQFVMMNSAFIGKEQIMFLKDGTFCLTFGNEYGMTELDAQKVQEAYKCKGPFPKPKAIDRSCKDERGINCAKKAANGDCTNNPAYMMENCRKTCNKNHLKDWECDWMAREGRCIKNFDFMLDNCFAKCNSCIKC